MYKYILHLFILDQFVLYYLILSTETISTFYVVRVDLKWKILVNKACSFRIQLFILYNTKFPLIAISTYVTARKTLTALATMHLTYLVLEKKYIKWRWEIELFKLDLFYRLYAMGLKLTTITFNLCYKTNYRHKPNHFFWESAGANHLNAKAITGEFWKCQLSESRMS